MDTFHSAQSDLDLGHFQGRSFKLLFSHHNTNVCVCVAVTEDLLAAVYIYYKQKNLTLQTRSLLLSFYSKLYLQEQGHTHIAR